MKNNKKKERSIVILLIVAVLLMTVGFAAYAQTLNINGTVKVKANSWNVHYVSNDITKSQGSVDATSATIDTNDTNFAFTVNLQKPGDFYEATINVINEGTIDAVLKKLTMSTLTDAQKKYLSYKVSYNGTEYTASNENLSVALAAEATHPVVVRVEYLQPANASDLPSEDVEVTVTGSLYYEDTL